MNRRKMTTRPRNNGLVLLITVFVIALVSAVVVGLLQMTTEEIQIMSNQVYTTEALATAEAGLNDAFAELRADSGWTTGFTNKSFNGGSYTVTVSGTLPSLSLESTSTSSQGFVARAQTDIRVGASGPPYAIVIDALRINE